jgi:hypothetical protein
MPTSAEASARGATGRKQMRGIYAVLAHNVGAKPATLANPNVDGIVVRTYWKDVEPGAGQYNWSFLDGQVAAATASGKRFVLVVLPGAFAPNWALQGAQTALFQATYGFINGQTMTLAMPWDPTYLARWFAFVRVFSQRYDPNPGLQLVPAAGPTSVSAEMSLPNDAPALAQWRSLGYTPQKFIDAWTQTLAAYVQAFPTTQIALTLFPGLPIPNRSASDQTRQSVFALALGQYAGQVTIEANGLSARKQARPPLGEQLIAQSAGKTTVGFEMGTSATDKPARMGSEDPVVALRDSIDLGLKAGANYLEIYEKDVDNPGMQDTLGSAHAKLWHPG